MDIGQAIRYAYLVLAAYKYPPPAALDVGSVPLPPEYDIDKLGYRIIASISANDLWTDINILRPQIRVPIGFVLVDKNNDAVIALRGTEGIFEWIHDALYLQKNCPFPGGAGHTEDGFTDMYDSLRKGMNGTAKLIEELPTLSWDVTKLNSITICGHSLGSALCTYLAYDIAENSTIACFKRPTVYTFASPRSGDPVFSLNYNAAVPDTYRVANDVDLVPHLPTELPVAQVPFYHHVGELFALTPFGPVPKCANLVQRTVKCHHVIESYLNLLYLAAGRNPAFPLLPECIVPVI